MTPEQLDLLKWMYPPEKHPQWWRGMPVSPCCGAVSGGAFRYEIGATDGREHREYLCQKCKRGFKNLQYTAPFIWDGPNPWHPDQDTADLAAFRVLRPWLLERKYIISEGAGAIFIHDFGPAISGHTYSAALIAACEARKEGA